MKFDHNLCYLARCFRLFRVKVILNLPELCIENLYNKTNIAQNWMN